MGHHRHASARPLTRGPPPGPAVLTTGDKPRLGSERHNRVAVASGPIAGREARPQAAETLRDSAIRPHGCPGHVQASSSGQDAPHSHSQSPEERVESEQAGIIQKGRRACASGSRGCELPTQVDTGCACAPRPPDAPGGRDTQARPAGGLGSGIWGSVKTMG